MDEFIHWPKPYILVAATCDEALSQMIDILDETLQGMTTNVELPFSVGDTTRQFTIKIGDTK
jgi:hypothetical protein